MSTLVLGCHSACFWLEAWLPRSFSDSLFECLWPPGNWSSLPLDYHVSHLIWLNLSLVVPLGVSVREYSPWGLPPLTWTSLLPGHHKNHLIRVDSSLMVPWASFETLSLRSTGPASPAWSSLEPSALSGLDQADPSWLWAICPLSAQ